jgi:hypothetical protein
LRIQHRLLEEIRSGQPGSNDPETLLAKVTEDLRQSERRETAGQLLKQLASYPGEALALVLHNLEHEKLSPEEKRGRRARKATHYRQRRTLCGTSEPPSANQYSVEALSNLKG